MLPWKPQLVKQLSGRWFWRRPMTNIYKSFLVFVLDCNNLVLQDTVEWADRSLTSLPLQFKSRYKSIAMHRCRRSRHLPYMLAAE